MAPSATTGTEAQQLAPGARCRVATPTALRCRFRRLCQHLAEAHGRLCHFCHLFRRRYPIILLHLVAAATGIAAEL